MVSRISVLAYGRCFALPSGHLNSRRQTNTKKTFKCELLRNYIKNNLNKKNATVKKTIALCAFKKVMQPIEKMID